MKTLEELNELAKEHGFGGAHNAITCADSYRAAYSEQREQCVALSDVLRAIKGTLSADLNKLIDDKLKESRIVL